MEFSQIVYAILGGIICKVYDDLNDMDILRSEKINEILKGGQWMILTLLSINDFNFSILFYLIQFINYLANPNEWSNSYESSLLYLYPFLIILSFHTRRYITIPDILILVFFCIFSILEPLNIIEEISYKKLFIRSIGSIIISILLFISLYFNISPSIKKILLYFLGYTVISTYFQIYNLSNVPLDIKS